MANIGPLDSAADFLMNAPLYAEYAAEVNGEEAEKLFLGIRFDGHCVECGNKSVLYVHPDPNAQYRWNNYQGEGPFLVRVRCARDADHEMVFHIRSSVWVFQKVGQFPSLADVANDESKTYRSVLDKADGRELHKAIGLAAHGVGIGSYVYLRRVFERLIQRRFAAHHKENNWDQSKFRNLRMIERIELLKNYLPEFLVENKTIYGILSQGLHELDEDECLAFFPILKESIVTILDDDKRAWEKEEQRKKLAQQIAAFKSTKPQQSD